MAKRKKDKKLEFKPSERRAQIREEIRDLTQEYLKTWDTRDEAVCTGYVLVGEFILPNQNDVDSRGWVAMQPESMSIFAARGLALQFLNDR